MGRINQFTKIITDESLMEKVSHGSSAYPFHYYYEHMALFDFHRIDWHWHSELEFIYIETGNVTFDVGNNHFTLNSGQGIMINSKILHRLYSSADAIIPNFLFHPSFIAPVDSIIYEKNIAPVISSSTEYIVFYPEVLWQSEVIDTMKRIFALQNKEKDPELLVSMLIQKLWIILFQNHTFHYVENNSTTLSRTRLQLMMQYIHTHYTENISLDDIAEAAHVSKSTALHLFQNNLKITPVNYLIHYRLHQAASFLTNTEKSITAIAMETGFHSVDYFCRSFKKEYHTTPTNYRNKMFHFDTLRQPL